MEIHGYAFQTILKWTILAYSLKLQNENYEVTENITIWILLI